LGSNVAVVVAFACEVSPVLVQAPPDRVPRSRGRCNAVLAARDENLAAPEHALRNVDALREAGAVQVPFAGS
jgi:hypothetical protein